MVYYKNRTEGTNRIKPAIKKMKKLLFIVFSLLITAVTTAQVVEEKVYSEMDDYTWYRIKDTVAKVEGARDSFKSILIPLSRGYRHVDFTNGYFIIENDEGKTIGVCNKNGKEIISPDANYDNIIVYDAYISVYRNGKEGACNFKGKEIIPPIYNYIIVENGTFYNEDSTGQKTIINAAQMKSQEEPHEEFFLKKWWKDEDYRFPHHYSELIGSYSDRERRLFLGTNYTYISGKMGLYGSFIYGFKNGVGGDWRATIGPVFRLTNSHSTSVDIHLFQGVGLHYGQTSTIGKYGQKIYNDKSPHIAGETGIRFGFGRDKKFAKWSLSGSITYSTTGIGWTAGISWPIAGITAASALIVGYVILVSYTGTSVPDLSGNGGGSTTTSSSSSGKNVSSNSTGNCDFYQDKYRETEQAVEKLYNDIKDMQRKSSVDHMSVNQTALMGAKKTYRSMQKTLKKWRTGAKGKGCNISASVWETKSL